MGLHVYQQHSHGLSMNSNAHSIGQMTLEHLATRYADIVSSPDDAARSQKIQRYCEDVWLSLSTNTALEHLTSDERQNIEHLTSLLRVQDNVSVIVHVIPGLRQNADLSRLSPAQLAIHEDIKPATFDVGDDAAFAYEKSTLRDIEVYRACLFLCHTGTPSVVEEQRIRSWLAPAPWNEVVAPRESSTSSVNLQSSA